MGFVRLVNIFTQEQNNAIYQLISDNVDTSISRCLITRVHRQRRRNKHNT